MGKRIHLDRIFWKKEVEKFVNSFGEEINPELIRTPQSIELGRSDLKWILAPHKLLYSLQRKEKGWEEANAYLQGNTIGNKKGPSGYETRIASIYFFKI